MGSLADGRALRVDAGVFADANSDRLEQDPDALKQVVHRVLHSM